MGKDRRSGGKDWYQSCLRQHREEGVYYTFPTKCAVMHHTALESVHLEV
jgi:hypothetical protein